MINIENVLKYVADSREGAELLLELNTGGAVALGEPHCEPAGELADTFGHRLETSSKAGQVPGGLEASVGQLKLLPPDSKVWLCHFSSPRRVFTVFVEEGKQRPLGVIMIASRWADHSSRTQ